MERCSETGCQNPILGQPGLMGGLVLCREHVMAYYPGVTTLEEARRLHATAMRGALGYGEDAGDDVRQNLADWQPHPDEDLAIMRAVLEQDAG